MAVQTHYPFEFFRDGVGLEESPLNQNWEGSSQAPTASAHMANFPFPINESEQNGSLNAGGTVFSNLGGELAGNMQNMPRKRTRIDDSLFSPVNGFPLPSSLPVTSPPLVPMGCRTLSPAMVSTSGRALACEIHRQNMEIDMLLRANMLRMRVMTQEALRRQWLTAAAAATKRVREKDAELEAALRRNLELEEQVRALTEENQLWHKAASNNEAVVARLQSSLVQILDTRAEGSGDSSDVVIAANAGEAESTCNAGAGAGEADVPRYESSCRVCRKDEISVLVLPCRHLCLCKGCEPATTACPACDTAKDGSLHVFLA